MGNAVPSARVIVKMAATAGEAAVDAAGAEVGAVVAAGPAGVAAGPAVVAAGVADAPPLQAQSAAARAKPRMGEAARVKLEYPVGAEAGADVERNSTA
jgi:hypothetical protein